MPSFNDGTLPFGQLDSSSPKTILVVGLSRGGTSAFAGAISKLGVFSGQKSVHPNYEDSSLSEAMESRNKTRFEEIVARYNEQHEVWAFKRPSLLQHIEWVHPLLRNPYYILVFRDPAAVAARHIKDFSPNAFKAILRNFQKVFEIAENGSRNGIVVSYEKLVLQPKDYIEHLCHIVKPVSPNQDERIKAETFIKPSPPDYNKLQDTRSPFLGHLDSIENGEISGWACRSGSNDPVVVSISQGGIEIEKVLADLPRTDVLASGLHSTALCGFSLKLKPSLHLSGIGIAARIHGSSEDLNGSPMIPK